MNEHDQTEYAYKNGWRDAVRMIRAELEGIGDYGFQCLMDYILKKAEAKHGS